MLHKNQFNKYCLVACVVLLVLSMVGALMRIPMLWQPAILMSCIGLTMGIGYWEKLENYKFTLWIITGFVAAMIYSTDLIIWGGFNVTNKWIVLFIVQAIMFSMGTELSIEDFAKVIKMPWGVFVGVLCQFLIMPLLGFGLTKLFSFPPEVAFGIILIGSASSGLSSTVMCYIAKANLALSVSVTAVSTLAATLFTPLWTSVLGGSLIDIQFISMMMEVIKIVLIPIGAALLCDYLKNYASYKTFQTIHILAGICAAWLAFMAFGGWDYIYSQTSAMTQMFGNVMNYFTGAIVWSCIFTYLKSKVALINKIMPRISMFGIIFFTTTAVAAGRDNFFQVGVLLCVAMLIHNVGGIVIGYVMSRWIFRLSVLDSRTVALEVGLQNGGMAAGLAAGMGKLATVGLAAAIMTPIGNVTGSLLANYWRDRPANNEDKKENLNDAQAIQENS